MRKLKEIRSNQNGFIIMEAILSGIILIAIATCFFSIVMCISQQKSIEARMTAQYLIQGYLNTIEYHEFIGNEYNIPQQIEYNDRLFKIDVYKNLIDEDKEQVTVKIYWDFNETEQYEYQTRTFFYKK